MPAWMESFREIVPRRWGDIPADPAATRVAAAAAENAGDGAPPVNREAIAALAGPADMGDERDPDGQRDRIKTGFMRQIWEKIALAKQYPRMAKDRGYEGQPVVNFTLGREGDLLAVSIEQPSRHSLLDQAAMQTVRDAAPFPRIPEQLNLDMMKFKLPITFRLE
jgi:protein TonB